MGMILTSSATVHAVLVPVVVVHNENSVFGHARNRNHNVD